jgi:uncharacterized membrane-anchored protein
MRTRVLLLLGAAMVFGVVNWKVAGKERLRSSGQTVFLELAPVDPRSLMQGDYMALNFRLARDISSEITGKVESAGNVAVLKLDERRIGQLNRVQREGTLNPGEMRFRFRIRNDAVWLGTNAFFFHEGDAERYRLARYGEFRVNEDGDAMLVDLRDQNLQKMEAGSVTAR